MAPKNKKQEPQSEIEILRVTVRRFDCYLLGTTPIIFHRLSEKAKKELLFPHGGRKRSGDRVGVLKHEPFEEFRSSPYTDRDPKAPTLLQLRSSAPKKAMMGAALDLPNVNKKQIGRLVWVCGERIPIWGVPKLFMTGVIQSGMTGAPDIRTRAIVPRWAARVTVEYTMPFLSDVAVVNLLASAGMTQGLGDYRKEKGAGTYGSFELVEANDPRYRAVLKEGDRKAQIAAMETADPYDDESEELLTWFVEERERRENLRRELAAPKRRSRKGANGNGNGNGKQAEARR